MFLAKVVHCKRFQMKEAITLTRGDDFDVSVKLVIRAFQICILLPPCDL